MVQKRCQFCLKMLQKVPKASKTETVQAGTDRVKSKKLFKSLDNLFIAQKGTKNNVNNIVFEGV